MRTLTLRQRTRPNRAAPGKPRWPGMLLAMPKPKQDRGDLVRAASEIWNAEAPNISYVASIFVQCSLPYRDPGDVPVWTRRNGDLTMLVQPGWTTDRTTGEPISVGYPSGVMPRLLIGWLSTEAVRTRSPELELGDSLRGFMAKLHLKPTGGKNGSITKLRAQMERLFRARLSVQYDTDLRQAGADLSIASAWSLQWPARGEQTPEQHSLLPSVVRLSPDFYQRVVESPVPVNMDAIIALRGSALRIDLYTWLTYRMSYLHRPTLIPWEDLYVQFGSMMKATPAGRAQFRREVKGHLEKILIVYPQARVEVTDKGLMLRPSPPHVPFRGLRELSRGR